MCVGGEFIFQIALCRIKYYMLLRLQTMQYVKDLPYNSTCAWRAAWQLIFTATGKDAMCVG